VTALKQAQLLLARNAETFRNLVRNNPFGIYVVDADLKLQEASRGAAASGGPLACAPGRDFADLLHDLWPAPVATDIMERVRHTLATGEPYVANGHSRAPGPINDADAYDWRIDRIVLPDGQYGVACYFYDLSEHRRWEVHLEELDRRKDAFLATLSHELRNPLAPIRNAAHILSSPQIAPEQVRWASAVIQRQVSHMAWLLDDLLDLARVTQGKVSLRRTRVTLAAVVDTAVEAVRPLIDARHQRLTIDLPANLPQFEVDPLRLSQVLSNLLTNAAKYTDPEGRIGLAARVDHDSVEITVTDTGIGIAPESLERVFEMFAQVDHGDRRTEGGLGIGLALVRGLVALHGGTVQARSAGPGHGSTFVVRLPLARAEASGASGAAPGTCPEVPAAAARRVLVVDDSRDGADSLAMWLQAEGHDVRVAYGGHDAVATAQAWQPEIVLLDISMPGFDGYETAKALRKLPGGPALHLVAVTGWGQQADKHAAEDAGFDRHITKPIDLEALHALLRTRAHQRLA
jgi:signal transduction histidine kinase/ActR/RegA family two-component response regulator